MTPGLHALLTEWRESEHKHQMEQIDTNYELRKENVALRYRVSILELNQRWLLIWLALLTIALVLWRAGWIS